MKGFISRRKIYWPNHSKWTPLNCTPKACLKTKLNSKAPKALSKLKLTLIALKNFWKLFSKFTAAS